MAIVTPYVQTNINNPEIPNPTRDMMLRAFLQGQQGGIEGANKLTEQQQASNLQSQAGQKAQALAQQYAKDHPGEQVSASPQGMEINPTPQIKQKQFEIGTAVKGAQQVQTQYMKGLPKLQDQAQAIGEIQDSLNHPDQTSLGAIRTNLVKAYGMNRYNEAEAKSILPSSVYSAFSGLMNKTTGADESSLSLAQMKAVSNLLPSMLNTIQQRHETLKSSAMGMYPSNADPNMAPQSLGHAFDDQLDKLSKFSPAPPPQKGVVQEAPGIMGSLKDFLLGKQANRAPAQGSQGPQMPSSDDIAAEIARRKAAASQGGP